MALAFQQRLSLYGKNNFIGLCLCSFHFVLDCIRGVCVKLKQKSDINVTLPHTQAAKPHEKNTETCAKLFAGTFSQTHLNELSKFKLCETFAVVSDQQKSDEIFFKKCKRADLKEVLQT